MMLSPPHRAVLKDIAHTAIRYGLEDDQPHKIDLADMPAKLTLEGACFVTLKIKDQLRGCIGTLEPYRPLCDDVSHNTFAAAFKDPRFPSITESESAMLDIQLSVLTPAMPLICESEADLLTQLRPDIDGLIIKEGSHHATFLPSVWKSLTDPKEFVKHLKLKAGLGTEYWSANIRCFRYATESF